MSTGHLNGGVWQAGWRDAVVRGPAIGAVATRFSIDHQISGRVSKANEQQRTASNCSEHINVKLGIDSGSLPALASGWPCPAAGLAVRKNAATEGRGRN